MAVKLNGDWGNQELGHPTAFGQGFLIVNQILDFNSVWTPHYWQFLYL